MRRFALASVLLTLLGVPAVTAASPAQPAPAAEAPVAAAHAAPPVVSFPLAPMPMFDLGPAFLCLADATCADGSTISCFCNNSSCSCDGADQNCDTGVQGHVTCGSTTINCSADLCCTYPPQSSCTPNQSCEPGCGNCGPLMWGDCESGRCVCIIQHH